MPCIVTRPNLNSRYRAATVDHFRLPADSLAAALAVPNNGLFTYLAKVLREADGVLVAYAYADLKGAFDLCCRLRDDVRRGFYISSQFTGITVEAAEAGRLVLLPLVNELWDALDARKVEEIAEAIRPQLDMPSETEATIKDRLLRMNGISPLACLAMEVHRRPELWARAWEQAMPAPVLLQAAE